MGMSGIVILKLDFLTCWFFYALSWVQAQSSLYLCVCVCVLGSLGFPGQKGEKGNTGATGPKGLTVSFEFIIEQKK